MQATKGYKILNANQLASEELILDLVSQNGDRAGLSLWLRSNLGTDVFNAWVAIKDDEPIGVITVEIKMSAPQEMAGFITFNRGHKGLSVAKDLLMIAEKWLKEREITKLVYYTPNRQSAEKCGFTFVTSVMTKEI